MHVVGGAGRIVGLSCSWYKVPVVLRWNNEIVGPCTEGMGWDRFIYKIMSQCLNVTKDFDRGTTRPARPMLESLCEECGLVVIKHDCFGFIDESLNSPLKQINHACTEKRHSYSIGLFFLTRALATEQCKAEHHRHTAVTGLQR